MVAGYKISLCQKSDRPSSTIHSCGREKSDHSSNCSLHRAKSSELKNKILLHESRSKEKL